MYSLDKIDFVALFLLYERDGGSGILILFSFKKKIKNILFQARYTKEEEEGGGGVSAPKYKGKK